MLVFVRMAADSVGQLGFAAGNQVNVAGDLIQGAQAEPSAEQEIASRLGWPARQLLGDVVRCEPVVRFWGEELTAALRVLRSNGLVSDGFPPRATRLGNAVDQAAAPLRRACLSSQRELGSLSRAPIAPSV